MAGVPARCKVGEDEDSGPLIGMDVLLRGGGFSNKGDQAMGMVVKQELLKRFNAINFWNRVPRSDAASAWRSGYIVSSGPAGKMRKGIALAAASLTNSHVRKALFVSPLSAFEITQLHRVNAVLDIGGFAYGDVWGTQAAKRALAWATYCRSVGKPYFLLPQAWGPFNDARLRDVATKLIESAALVYARDQRSLSYLSSLQADMTEKVRWAPDLAFRLAPAAPKIGAAILAQHGVLHGARPIIAIAPNMRVYERCAGVGYRNVYVRLLTDIARFCLTELDASVVLIPHEQMGHDKSAPDDRFLCGLVKGALADNQHCLHLSVCDDPTQTMAVLGHCELVIASRFHVLVLSLASGVPTVAVGWAHKYEELLGEVGLVDYAIQFQALADVDVRSMIQRAWQLRRESQRVVRDAVSRLGAHVDTVFDSVAEALIAYSDSLRRRNGHASGH